MVEIPVRGGHVALVDDEDAELVRKHKWRLARHRRTWYAATAIYHNGKPTTIQMHRLIWGLSIGDAGTVDHKNRNGLDCRRENLRLATRTQQNANMEKKSTVRRYKGVHQRDRRRPFWAEIKSGDDRRYLGSFFTAEEAAMRYNVEARKLFGEFACLNEVDMG